MVEQVRASRRASAIGLLVVTLVMVGGCAPVVVAGVAGVAGGTAAVKAGEKRGLEGALSDAEIHTRINALWLGADSGLLTRINLSVDQGRVLLTGHAETAEQRMTAVRLVWEVPGVTEVINEVTVDNQAKLIDGARDTWIATRLRTSIMFDRDIHSSNYSIDVVDGIVYLMGVTDEQSELNQVIAYAKALPHVQGVVSHVRVR